MINFNLKLTRSCLTPRQVRPESTNDARPTQRTADKRFKEETEPTAQADCRYRAHAAGQDLSSILAEVRRPSCIPNAPVAPIQRATLTRESASAASLNELGPHSTRLSKTRELPSHSRFALAILLSLFHFALQGKKLTIDLLQCFILGGKIVQDSFGLFLCTKVH
jgi:hypothetical protein